MIYNEIETPSDDYKAMAPYWKKVDTIIEGIDAMRRAKKEYLPKFPNESEKDYDFRLSVATMTNVYTDVVESLADKPFSDEVRIIDNDQSNDEFIALAENIDGRGNHIHVFLSDVFFHGINAAIDWILIDYPVVNTNIIRTREQELALGLRPYWVQIRAKQVLDVKTEMINGIETLVYVKILEKSDRIRVFELIDGAAYFTIYTKDDKGDWWPEDPRQLTIDVIPMVPFYTGKRKGDSWQFRPPLKDAADLQIELWQKETGLKHTRTLAAFPMLAGNGIQPSVDAAGKPLPLKTGPNAVLYAPPNDNGTSGSWGVLSADSATMQFLAADVTTTQQQIRELGRQPLTAQSGNVTRITAAFAASKGNSAVQKWALGLKDAAEQALTITSKWLKLDIQPELFIFTDFKVELDDDKTPDYILQMRSNGDLSRRSMWAEMKRRGILSTEFDSDVEDVQMANEIPTSDGF